MNRCKYCDGIDDERHECLIYDLRVTIDRLRSSLADQKKVMVDWYNAAAVRDAKIEADVIEVISTITENHRATLYRAIRDANETP